MREEGRHPWGGAVKFIGGGVTTCREICGANKALLAAWVALVREPRVQL